MSSKRTCFVIMPFGVKGYFGGKMNFDWVFDDYISKGADIAGYKVERADRTDESGVITERMMELIYNSPVSIVDITTNNPNVFYELGVRHTLYKRGTVLIRRKGSGNSEISALSSRGATEDIPFNIRNMTVFDYEVDESGRVISDPQRLADKIITTSNSDRTDSLPYVHLPQLRIDIRKRPATGPPKTVRFPLPTRPTVSVGYRTGDIRKVQDVDFWVNSENVLMQMARFYEQSISSSLRYLGAQQPDPQKDNFEDTIALALARALGKRVRAEEAEVLVTEPGRLAETHNVKRILHVASARGSWGQGWHPLEPESLGRCVENVIREARSLVRRGDDPVAGRSILIPLLGTGQARGEPDRICGVLLQAAIDELMSSPPHPKSKAGDIEDVLFLAYSEIDELMLERLFDVLQRDQTLGSPKTETT